MCLPDLPPGSYSPVLALSAFSAPGFAGRGGSGASVGGGGAPHTGRGGLVDAHNRAPVGPKARPDPTRARAATRTRPKLETGNAQSVGARRALTNAMLGGTIRTSPLGVVSSFGPTSSLSRGITGVL